MLQEVLSERQGARPRVDGRARYRAYTRVCTPVSAHFPDASLRGDEAVEPREPLSCPWEHHSGPVSPVGPVPQGLKNLRGLSQ